MEGDTLDDSSIGESLQKSLQCGEKNIPQTTDSDSVDAEYPEEPNRKRKLAEEEDAPEEPNMKRKLGEDEHSAGSKRSEGPASFMSRLAAYKNSLRKCLTCAKQQDKKCWMYLLLNLTSQKYCAGIRLIGYICKQLKMS